MNKRQKDKTVTYTGFSDREQYVEIGEYPARLSLTSVAEWDPMTSRAILREFSSIENYRARGGLYSFDAISSSGKHRIKVVDCEIRGVESR